MDTSVATHDDLVLTPSAVYCRGIVHQVVMSGCCQKLPEVASTPLRYLGFKGLVGVLFHFGQSQSEKVHLPDPYALLFPLCFVIVHT